MFSHLGHIMQLSLICKHTDFSFNYSSEIVIQSSPIYIPTCTWLPSGMFLPCSPGQGSARKEKPSWDRIAGFESFLCRQFHWGTLQMSFPTLCLFLQVSLWYVMWGDVRSELLAPMQSQKTGGLIFYHIFVLSLVLLQNDSLSLICLLLELIQIHYYAYFTCGRTDIS